MHIYKIPGIQETEIRRITFEASQGKYFVRPYLKKKKKSKKETGRIQTPVPQKKKRLFT
jgi:hypothetical protein